MHRMCLRGDLSSQEKRFHEELRVKAVAATIHSPDSVHILLADLLELHDILFAFFSCHVLR